MKLEEVKKQYDGEWIAFLIRKGKEDQEIEGDLILHDPDRRALHQKLRDKYVKDAYVTFAGPLVKPGYSVMFL
ncbi:hypothetical protein KAW55_04070 [bacterium]|nr:hypothetical protein [bacterium]